MANPPDLALVPPMQPANDGLTKADLVEEVARAAQLTKKQAEAIVYRHLKLNHKFQKN